MQSRACAARVEFMAGYLLKFSVADTQPLHSSIHVQYRIQSDLADEATIHGNQTLGLITFLQNVELMLDGAESWLVGDGGRDKGSADAEFAIYGRRFRISSSCLLLLGFV